MDILTQIITITGSLGGLELIKLWVNRKSNARLAKVEADMAEFNRYRSEVEFLHTHCEALEHTLAEKENRFQDLLTQLRNELDKNNDLTTLVAQLKAELDMKRCEVRGCTNRKPKSEYF